ncbi:MAG: hypothetical protein AB1767_03480 [Bacillota bacterium]
MEKGSGCRTAISLAGLETLICEEMHTAGIGGGVGVFRVEPAVREQAASRNLSVSRYLLLEALPPQEAGPKEEFPEKLLLELFRAAGAALPGRALEIKSPGGV